MSLGEQAQEDRLCSCRTMVLCVGFASKVLPCADWAQLQMHHQQVDFLTKEQSGGHWIGCYERENVGAASVLAKQTQEQSCCAQLSPVGSDGGRAHLMSEVVCSHQFDLAGFYKGST